MLRNPPRQIGITGGIGCGKSTVSRIFGVLGIPVYDADTRAKWLMNNDLSLKNQIVTFFGKESYLPDGQLNRTYLAHRAFTNAAQTQQLNQLVHPRVGEDYQHWLSQHSRMEYVMREAALLFEAGAVQQLAAVIVVTAPLQLRISRVLRRDPHRTEADIRDIIAKQMPEEEKIRRASHLVANDETQLVISQVLQLNAIFSAV
jgi:dephospho-CoA kinase